MENANKINIFMDWIYNKPVSKFTIGYWIYYFKFRRFIKEFKMCNPDFVTLWHIISFIRLLKITFFYRYNRESELFSIDDLPQENVYNAGFILYENHYSIEFRLNRSDRLISIKVVDTLQAKSKSVFSKIEFIEGTLRINTISDQFQYDYLNALITKRVADILVYYFKNF